MEAAEAAIWLLKVAIRANYEGEYEAPRDVRITCLPPASLRIN